MSSSFRILDSRLYNLIAPTLGPAFFLLMACTLAVASSLSSGRAYPSLNFLPSLFFRLTPTLIIEGSTFLQDLSTPACSLLLMFMLPLFTLLRQISKSTPFLPNPFLLQKSLHSGRLQLPSTPLGLKTYLRPPWGGSIQLGDLL